MKGDSKVNSVLDCKIQRESQLTRKKSVTVRAENIFQSVRNRNTVSGEIPGTTRANVRVTVAGEDGTDTVLTLPGEGGDLAPSPVFI